MRAVVVTPEQAPQLTPPLTVVEQVIHREPTRPVAPAPARGVLRRSTPEPVAGVTGMDSLRRALRLLRALVDKYRQAAHVERAASMSHTMGGIPRMDVGSSLRSFSKVGTESGCGTGVTMRRCLVSTCGTVRGVMLNSLPIILLTMRAAGQPG